MRHRLSSILPHVLLLLMAFQADAVDYTFENIADDTGSYLYFVDSPLLGEDGSVFFEAVDTGSGGRGIYFGADPSSDYLFQNMGGPESPIDIFLGMRVVDRDNWVISSVVQGMAGNYGALHSGADPGESTIVDTLFHPPLPPYSQYAFEAFDFADNGHVAFLSKVAGEWSGVFTGDDPLTDAVARTGSEFLIIPTEGVPRGVDIASDGSVAFVATPFLANTFCCVHGIYLGDNPETDTFVDTSGPYQRIRDFSRNNNGDIFFRANLDDGRSGVFRGPNPEEDMVFLSEGPFERFASLPVLNDAGEYVFVAGGTGISTGFGPMYHSIYHGFGTNIESIIARGDSLFGAEIVGLRIERGFNNRGQIAFLYLLNNGVSGIALATPVPEPNAAALLAACCLMGLVCRGVASRPRKHLQLSLDKNLVSHGGDERGVAVER